MGPAAKSPQPEGATACVALPRTPSRPPRRDVPLGEWLRLNEGLLQTADVLLRRRLHDRKCFGEHGAEALCDAVFDVVRQSLEGQGGECSSVLVLGEAGSGKTHAVERCLARLRVAHPALVVLRAHGAAYATDVECTRHLASQAADQVSTAPRGNASFEQVMEWMRTVLADTFQHASAVVIVLDRFEHFCSRARQTLLYNLFDTAQEMGVRLSIIGMSERMDVMNMLEKRIRSRFSMSHLHAFLPETMEDLVKVLSSKLRLSPEQDLPADFLQELDSHVQASLWAKAGEWRQHLQVGRSPPWFLWQCLPLAAFLHAAAGSTAGAEEARSPCKTPAQKRPLSRCVSEPGSPDDAAAPPAAKRQQLGCLPSATKEQANDLLLRSLSEAEHIILLALWRLRSREVPLNLARVLYEVQLLHEAGGLVSAFLPDTYCAAFDRLAQMRFVEVRTQGAADAPRRYQPCHSFMDQIYAALVRDLERPGAGACKANPLRGLPSPVQQWAQRNGR